MLNRFVTVVIFIPLAIVLIALAVANRGLVAFTIDPFNPGNPGLTLSLPLFVLLFAALVLGIIIGSVVTWWRQGRYRKAARRNKPIQSSGQSDYNTAASRQPGLPAPGA